LDRLLRLWPYLVDPRVGVIREVSEVTPDEDEPNFFHYLAETCDTGAFTALNNFRNNGGVSSDRYTAIAKAIGESVERYCSAIFRYSDLAFSSYRDLERRAARPQSFALYRADQFETVDFPWQPFTVDTPLFWSSGVSLVDGQEILVPAAMVYVPFHYLRSRGDTPIVQPISTGLASGCSFTEAALGALCEVVERDAFTIMWQASMARPRIDVRSLPEDVGDLVRRFWEVGIDVHIVDITTDIQLPTVMTVAVGDADTSPAVAVAAATDPSARVATIKSLEELAHTRKFARQLMDYTPEVPLDVAAGHPHVAEQRDHLRIYCPQHAKVLAAFSWSSSDERDFAKVLDRDADSAEEALASAVAAVSDVGEEVIACDLTTPDIRDLGLSVVRVVVPGAHPLFMGYRTRALGGTRLYTVPQLLGEAGIEPGGRDNPYPHPFP
jgi:ribosomal protein S12 methylthiotransferase accessory factor